LNKQIINKDTLSFLKPFVEVATAPAMRIALINSAGIGCYAYNQKLVKQGLLVDVFPDLPDHIISYYYIYHKRLEGSLKIEAFYNFLKEINKIWERREEKDVHAL
jgi:DNA-binding transcriptional LysR family regulator